MNNISLATPCLRAAWDASTVNAEFVTIRRRSTDWVVAPYLVGELFDADDLKLNEWLNSGRAEIVKDGSHRTVYRLRLDCGTFYLKHYRTPRLRKVLLNLVRACHAVLEENAARQVASTGVETIEPLAVGRTKFGPITTDSYLLTRAIENAVPLDELVQQRNDRSRDPLSPRLRQALAIALGELVGRLHSGGLIHGDLHAGNVLVRILPDESVRLWLIDPCPMRRHSKLSMHAIEQNLSLLNNFFAPLTVPADRSRFFRAYWRTLRTLGRNRLPAEISGLAELPHATIARIEKYCAVAFRICNRKNDRKWVTGNRRLIIADTKDRQCRGVAEIGRTRLAEIRENPESLFAESVVIKWVQQEADSKCAMIELPVDAGMLVACAVKADRFGSNDDARRVWEGGHALLRRSLGAPRPLLFVEQTIGGGITQQYLLVEPIPNAVPLAAFLRSPQATERVLRDAASRLAKAIRSMQECDIVHTALSADSVLINLSGSRCEFAFWSLEHVEIGRDVFSGDVLTSLARLDATIESVASLRLTHRLRFLRRYLHEQYRDHWKTYWRAIAGFRRDPRMNFNAIPSAFPFVSIRAEKRR